MAKNAEEAISDSTRYLGDEISKGAESVGYFGDYLSSGAKSATTGALNGVKGSLKWAESGVDYALGNESPKQVPISTISANFLNKYDSDLDGALSFSEWRQFSNSADSRLDKMNFNYIDSDMDEVISDKEL